MKIIMFQDNMESSAIVQGKTMSQEHCTKNRLAANSFSASGYEDRLLWEEATSLRPEKKREYVISGAWQ